MLAIIDYGAGNLTSVKLAFEALRIEATVTGSAAEIRAAERVVFPGVGAAGAAMRNLAAQGLVDVIRELPRRGIPFLGICLGTQILLSRSDEDGGVDALDIIPGRVKRFAPSNRYEKVPQMGWNRVHQTQAHPVFEGIADQSEFYFVHSYYPAPESAGHVLGTTQYAGVTFASAVAAGSVVATQFHVEKSGRVGLRFLENFCRWQPGNGDA